jgi:hypothetical protein
MNTEIQELAVDQLDLVNGGTQAWATPIVNAYNNAGGGSGSGSGSGGGENPAPEPPLLHTGGAAFAFTLLGILAL